MNKPRYRYDWKTKEWKGLTAGAYGSISGAMYRFNLAALGRVPNALFVLL